MHYKEVPGFPNTRVGTDGTLWTRSILGRARRGEPRLLGGWKLRVPKPRKKDLRVQVRLSYGSKTWNTGLHAVILTTFVGPRPAGHLGCHRNDIQHDNRIENLYWGTPKSNCLDRTRNGKTGQGIKNYKAKLTDDAVRYIRQQRAQGVPRALLSAKYGIDKSQISRICSGTAWGHIT